MGGLQSPCRLWKVPTRMFGGWPYMWFHVYIYAVCVLSDIYRFLAKSCRTGRYPDLVQYYLFLKPAHALS